MNVEVTEEWTDNFKRLSLPYQFRMAQIAKSTLDPSVDITEHLQKIQLDLLNLMDDPSPDAELYGWLGRYLGFEEYCQWIVDYTNF